MWCRVFALTETAPDPEAILPFLRSQEMGIEVKIDADNKGWFHLELMTSADTLLIDRYLADEGIRDDLNTWAAWLEQHGGDRAPRLMQHMISTRQMITMRREDRRDEPESRAFMRHLGRWLAERCEGICQIDDEGFFDAAGDSLVRETLET